MVGGGGGGGGGPGGVGVRAPHHTNVYKILRLCGAISLPPFRRITFKLGK